MRGKCQIGGSRRNGGAFWRSPRGAGFADEPEISSERQVSGSRHGDHGGAGELHNPSASFSLA